MRPVVIVGPQGAGKSQALAKLVSLVDKGQLVAEWDGVTPLNGAQVALTNAPIRWQGSMLVLSVDDVAMMEAVPVAGSRAVMRAAERLLFGGRPYDPLTEASRLLQLAIDLHAMEHGAGAPVWDVQGRAAQLLAVHAELSRGVV